MPDAKESRGKHVSIVVPKSIKAERIDRYLSKRPDLILSRTSLQKLIEEGLVTVNGSTVSKKHLLEGGEKVEISIPPPTPTDLVPEDIPLNIVFEDEHLVVVDKPAGMVTHPAAGNRTGTLANAMAFRFGKLAAGSAPDRPGIVHRLDRDTSGLLVVARTDRAYAALQQAIQTRTMKRTYLGIVCGHMPDESGKIDLSIGRSLRDRRKMSVTGTEARDAVTLYQLQERYRSYDLLRIILETGRTHQIRVHCSHLNHPILGDPDYGGRESWHNGLHAPERPLAKRLLKLINRQALHAHSLEFSHPITEKELSFKSELPDDFQAVVDLLNAEGR
ncbi:MAG: RluA family pseudouridine synthase [Candidatus Zixiibacteriota bacterium]|nr:MAG: RluA family pseudouridine synthase [candidate division Zixibacteria bacterium]